MLRLRYYPLTTPEGQRLDLVIELILPEPTEPRLRIAWSSTGGAPIPEPWDVRLPHRRSSVQLIGPIIQPRATYTATITSPTHPELDVSIIERPFDRIE